MTNSPQPLPRIPDLALFEGPHMIVAGILQLLMDSIFTGLVLAFIIFMLRVLLRNTWVVGVGLSLLVCLLAFLDTSSVIATVLMTLFAGLVFFVFIRFGLLASMASFFLLPALRFFPRSSTDVGLVFQDRPHRNYRPAGLCVLCVLRVAGRAATLRPRFAWGLIRPSKFRNAV